LKIQELDGDYKTLHRKKAKPKKKFRKMRFWIKLAVAMPLLFTILVLIALSPVFNITDIEVQGSKYYKSDEIIDLSDILIGSNGFKGLGNNLANILELRNGDAEERILKSCPYIKDVTVKFVPPGKIRINIIERSPMAVVPYIGTSLIIDSEGYVLDTVRENEAQNFLLIKGLEFDYFELGEKLELSNSENFDKVVQVINEIKESDEAGDYNLLGLIDSIDISDSKKIRLFIESRLVINLGDTRELNYKIAVLRQVLMKNIKKKDRGLLDFTAGENPVFIPE
jgi:cell division protein FtsQ